MNELFKTVTVQQFKDYFFRDFQFLPTYVEGKVYWADDVVFYNGVFYKSLVDNNTSLPTDTADWQVTKDDELNYILDQDIEKAMSQAIINGNERFGADDTDKINIYLHLIAFYLVVDFKNSSAGLNSTYAGLVASKSVGSVSESYNFPQWVVNSPLYSLYNQNGYGMKYLSLILPYLSVTVLFSRGYSTYG